MKLERKTVSGNAGNGSFLKIASGTSVTGVFRGEVFEFWQKWPNGGEKQVFFDEAKAMAANAKPRFKLNFVTKDDDGKLVAKVWEFGLGTYNELAEINAEYPLEETVIKITRKGEGKNTEYHLLPLVRQPLNKKQLNEIAAVELQKLEPVAHEPAGEFASEMDEDTDEVPF